MSPFEVSNQWPARDILQGLVFMDMEEALVEQEKEEKERENKRKKPGGLPGNPRPSRM